MKIPCLQTDDVARDGHQASGEAIPAIDVANRPAVIGTSEQAEAAIAYGHAARAYYGQLHPSWTSELEHRLAGEWKSETMPWKTAEILVHHGYDVRH